MIQIDDAGSGSLLGGTIIGIYRVETDEYAYGVIPLSHYQGEAFQRKEYIHYVVGLVQDLFPRLRVNKEETIQVCQGYMFESLNQWLKEEGYSFTNTKIGEPLQSVVEKTFDEYAISLGLPKEFIAYTKYPFHFHRILKWVYADYESRSKLCKTGWKSWKKYEHMPIKITTETLQGRDWICLKCNQLIHRHSPVTVMSYHSNRFYKIYLHPHCAQQPSVSLVRA